MTAWSSVTDREVVGVHGPDAASFLQGQLSQDVSSMADGEARWSFLLDPQGKVVAILRVARRGPDGFVLLSDAGTADAVVGRLERFKLRVAADVVRVPATVVAVRGASAPVGSGIAVDAGWPGTEGVDVVLDPAAPADTVSALVPATDPATYHRARIEAGVPVVGVDVEPGAMPHETSMVAAAASFTKGCYTGQELVARVDSRGGNAPRRLVRVAGLDGAEVSVGASLTGGGHITSAARDLGLALVPRTVDVPGIDTVGDVEVVLEPLPW